MNVGIIGGGITGLTAAYELAKRGHTVTVFEKEAYLGGLAYGFKEQPWSWSVEAAYHHLFTNDTAILQLLKELHLESHIIIKRPITATLWKDKLYPLDSPQSLLQFPAIPFFDRLRTGLLLAGMKVFPFGTVLEGYTAADLFKTLGGQAAWNVIWEPLMVGKFGPYADTVAASWLWARIKKRTPNLAYIEGGFQTFINKLEDSIIQYGGKINKNTTVSHITSIHSKHVKNTVSYSISYGQKKHITVDTLLLTIPTPLISHIVPEMPPSFLSTALSIPHLHAQVLIIESEAPILEKVYWVNITDRTYPFLAVVAHTNYMDPNHYGGKHLTYIGNYLPPDHPFIKKNKKDLLNHFLPYLQKINPTLKTSLHITNSYLFTAPFAQPVHQTHYSKKAPRMDSPLDRIFIANMDSIYPWDRGTNYAVELGQKAAQKLIHTSSR